MNNPKHIVNIFWTFLVLFLIGCTENAQDPSIFFNLEDEFVIRPVEILSADHNRLSLKISSLQPDACDDAEILYQYRLLDGISIIKLNDIISPTSCQSNINPPTTTIALTKSNPAEYKLNITIKEIIENIGQIVESEGHYDFHMQTLNGIRIDYGRLHKIPKTAIWGVIDYAFQDSSFVAEQFVSEIEQYDTELIFDSGYYGHFEKDISGNLQILNYPKQSTFRNSFVLESQATLAQLSPIIERYRSQYPGFSFKVFNGKGDSL